MKRKLTVLLTLIIGLAWGQTLQAQSGQKIQEIERQLDRLQEKLRETRQFARLFPNAQLDEVVQSAENQYNLAKEAFSQRQYGAAAGHIKLGFTILARVYRQVRNNPFLKTRFKEQLDQKIQEAEQIVSQSVNSDAQKLLNRARYFRQRAIQLAAGDRLEMALRHYFMAVFFANSAIRTASGQNPDDIKDLERYFEDSNSLLLQAQEMAADNRDATVRDMLNKAEQEIRKARSLYEQKRLRESFRQVELANRLLYRLLDMLESTPGSLAERLRHDLKTTENDTREVKSRVDQAQRPGLDRIYARIIELQQSARQKFEAGNFVAARQQLGIANRLLLQLSRSLQNRQQPAEDQVEAQLVTAEDMLSMLKRRAFDHPLVTRLLTLSEQNLEMARAEYKQKRPRAALQHLAIFNNLALKIEQMNNRNTTKSFRKQQLEEELGRLKQMLDNPPASTEGNDVQQIKYENAKKLHEIASQAWQDKDLQLCWQTTRLATNLLTQ